MHAKSKIHFIHFRITFLLEGFMVSSCRFQNTWFSGIFW